MGPEIGIHIPIGNLEPHLEVGGGYAAMGSFKGTVSGAGDAIHVRGFDARIGAGLDYFITPVLSVGAGASWEFLGLTRPGVDAATINRLGNETTVTTAQADALAANGTSYGSGDLGDGAGRPAFLAFPDARSFSQGDMAVPWCGPPRVRA